MEYNFNKKRFFFVKIQKIPRFGSLTPSLNEITRVKWNTFLTEKLMKMVCKLHTVTVVLDCKDRNAKCFKVLAGCKG